MPITPQELESFTQFAARRLHDGDTVPSLEECLQQWRADCERRELQGDVQASLDVILTVSAIDGIVVPTGNDKVVTDNTTCSAFMPGSRLTLVMRLATVRCGTRTPLGRPVDPEV